MDIDKVLNLIDEWLQIIVEGAQKSRISARELDGGLDARIPKSRMGRIAIFDHEGYEKQRKIQKQLAKQLPHMSDIIYSEPNMNEYRWKARDYIDLYYEHYFMVIQKIKKAENV